MSAVSRRFDDELPEPLPVPKPSGWFEVFCCYSIVIAIFVGLVVLAYLH